MPITPKLFTILNAGILLCIVIEVIAVNKIFYSLICALFLLMIEAILMSNYLFPARKVKIYYLAHKSGEKIKTTQIATKPLRVKGLVTILLSLVIVLFITELI